MDSADRRVGTICAGAAKRLMRGRARTPSKPRRMIDGMVAGGWCLGVRVGGAEGQGLRHASSGISQRPWPMRPELEQRPPNGPGDGHVDQDDMCACRCHCSEHSRHGIGCDQETKSPSQRPAGAGHRSAHRSALQSIQSRAHRRRQPWLQSKPHDLEVTPASQDAEADPLLAGCSRLARGLRRIIDEASCFQPRALVAASTSGLTTLIGRPAAKARIWSKMSMNCVSYSSRVT
jgi:hypothetical protein